MGERDEVLHGLSDEELEVLAGDEVPDRKAMVAASCDPAEFVDLELEGHPPVPDTGSQA